MKTLSGILLALFSLSTGCAAALHSDPYGGELAAGAPSADDLPEDSAAAYSPAPVEAPTYEPVSYETPAYAPPSYAPAPAASTDAHVQVEIDRLRREQEQLRQERERFAAEERGRRRMEEIEQADLERERREKVLLDGIQQGAKTITDSMQQQSHDRLEAQRRAREMFRR